MPSARAATNVRCGCLRGGGPTGLTGRTLVTEGESTVTWTGASATVPAAGPAARDARLRTAVFVADSGDSSVDSPEAVSLIDSPRSLLSAGAVTSRLPRIQHQVHPRLRGLDFVHAVGIDARAPSWIDEDTGLRIVRGGGRTARLRRCRLRGE